MMRQKIVLGLFCFFFCLSTQAQKKPILPTDYKNWQKLNDYGISDDGKYIWYSWQFIPDEFNNWKDYGLVLRSTNSSYAYRFKATSGEFIGHKFVTRLPGDTLCVFDLDSKKSSFFSNVINFKAFGFSDREFLIYQTLHELYVENLASHKRFKFSDISQYVISPDYKMLAFVTKTGELQQINLMEGITNSIVRLPDIKKLTYSNKSNRLAFISNTNHIHSIYQYPFGGRLEKILTDNDSIIADSQITDEHLGFSPDDKHIYFRIKLKPQTLSKDRDLKTDRLKFWNYKDIFLEGENKREKNSFLSVFSLENHRSVQLENDSVEVVGNLNANSKYILARNIVNDKISYWNKSQRAVYRLIDINTGGKVFFIPQDQVVKPGLTFSPIGKFITWQDQNTNQLFSYEVLTGKLYNNTESATLDFKTKNSLNNAFIGWLPDDNGFVVNNDFNIWQISPTNSRKILNLTGDNETNQKVQLMPEFLFNGHLHSKIWINVLDSNYNSGYASLQLGKVASFNINKLSPCRYNGIFGTKKANNADVYVTTRESVNQAPNIVVTTDFKDFKQLSDIHPQTEYNWLTSELVRWKMYDGRIGKGVLYKPENFDPQKRYPVIFHYYEKKSYELHQFRNIGSDNEIGNLVPVSEYVSNGYIVFIPDIDRLVPGDLAKVTINSVESAAKHLMKTYPWVDPKRLGLQGHSMGGYETNILIANSNLFAAASESAGHCDMVVNRGQTTFGDIGSDFHSEIGWAKFGENVFPWNATSQYLELSPIFKADKVTTPLLMKHAIDDGAVPFEQAQEWFTALRRLGKPVWLLEYLDGGHVISGPNAYDYALRQRQFFDHYLMGKPTPLWMTTSIPEKDQPFKSGLQYDLSGTKP